MAFVTDPSIRRNSVPAGGRPGFRPARPPAPRRIPRSLRLSFILFAAALPFEPIDLGIPYLSLAKITGILFFAVCLRFKGLCFPRPPRPVLWFAAYWTAIALYATLMPRQLWSSVAGQLVTLAQLILLFWTASALLRVPGLAQTILNTFAVSCAALATTTLLRVPGFVEESTDRVAEVRVTAAGYDLNDLGSVMGVASIVVMGSLLSGTRRPRWKTLAMCLMLVAMLAVIVNTGSRGGMLAVVMGMLVFLVPLASSRRRLAAFMAGALALVAVGFLIARNPSSIKRWTDTYTEGNVAGRDQIIERSIAMIKERPILGWGPIGNIEELGLRTGHPRRDTHNLILYILTEVGLLGCIPFFYGVWLCGKAAWRSRASALGILPLALFCVVLVINQSLTWLLHKPMWLVFALALAASTMKAKQGLRVVPAAPRG